MSFTQKIFEEVFFFLVDKSSFHLHLQKPCRDTAIDLVVGKV